MQVVPANPRAIRLTCVVVPRRAADEDEVRVARLRSPVRNSVTGLVATLAAGAARPGQRSRSRRRPPSSPVVRHAPQAACRVRRARRHCRCCRRWSTRTGRPGPASPGGCSSRRRRDTTPRFGCIVIRKVQVVGRDLAHAVLFAVVRDEKDLVVADVDEHRRVSRRRITRHRCRPGRAPTQVYRLRRTVHVDPVQPVRSCPTRTPGRRRTQASEAACVAARAAGNSA